MVDYLKMGDVFGDDVRICGGISYLEDGLTDSRNVKCSAGKASVYASHAVNTHDELVTEVKRLRAMLSECYPYIKERADWGNGYEQDLADRVFDAAI